MAAVRKRRTTVRSLASQQESFRRSRAASSVTSCLVGASSWGPPAREEERREKSSELRCWVASGLFLVSRQISAWTEVRVAACLRLCSSSSCTWLRLCRFVLAACLVARARSRVRQCSTQAVAQP